MPLLRNFKQAYEPNWFHYNLSLSMERSQFSRRRNSSDPHAYNKKWHTLYVHLICNNNSSIDNSIRINVPSWKHFMPGYVVREGIPLTGSISTVVKFHVIGITDLIMYMSETDRLLNWHTEKVNWIVFLGCLFRMLCNKVLVFALNEMFSTFQWIKNAQSTLLEGWHWLLHKALAYAAVY